MLRAGAAERAITPPVGVDLTGFVARLAPSNALRDDLFARALVLDDGATRLALLSLDLLGLSTDLAERIRGTIAAALGIPPTRVMLACSHTHSGPAALRLIGCGEQDPAWVASLPARLVAVAREAARQLRPARLGVATADVARDRLSMNRCVSDGPLDATLGVAWIDGLDGRPIATLVSFACHPVVLGPENLAISADWVGALSHQVSSARGGPTLFLNGACGDVNPARRGTAAIAQEMGERLASRALATIESAVRGTVSLRAAWCDHRVSLDRLPGLDELEAVRAESQVRLPWPPSPEGVVRQRIAAAMERWVDETRAAILQGTAPRDLPAPLQAFGIGDLAIVAVPGELFSRLGQEIKESLPSRATFVATYSNGSVGYIPTPEAYPLRGYETHAAYRYYGYPAPLAPSAGEELRDRAIALVRQI